MLCAHVCGVFADRVCVCVTVAVMCVWCVGVCEAVEVPQTRGVRASNEWWLGGHCYTNIHLHSP